MGEIAVRYARHTLPRSRVAELDPTSLADDAGGLVK